MSDNDNMSPLQTEVNRLAELPLEVFALELAASAKTFEVGKTDLRKAVDAARRAIKQRQKEQRVQAQKEVRAAKYGQSEIQLNHGSAVEIAGHFARFLTNSLGDIVYDEGAFWCYRQTDWQPIEYDDLHRLVHQYDGVPCGESGVVKLNTKFIESVLHETAMILRRWHFFVDAPQGVNCSSGFVRFVEDGEVELLAHDPEHRCRHTINAQWDQDRELEFEGSLFAKFLNTLFRYVEKGEQYMVLAQEVAGAVIAGLATKLKQPKCFIMVGESANNGKSTFIKLLRSLVPANVLSSVRPDDFRKDAFLIQLRGKVLNTSDELSVAALESAKIKAVIDGVNPITARDLYEKATEFHPRALHIFATQRLPSFMGGIDRGVRRRVEIIDFPKSIPAAHMIDGIVEKIIATEMDLVLAFAIDGAQRLIRNQQYTIPDPSEKRKADWLKEGDPVRAWIDARVRDRSESNVGYTPYGVYSHFREWATQWGYRNIPEKTEFYRRFAEEFPQIKNPRTAGNRHSVTGVTILESDYGDKPEIITDQATGEMTVTQMVYQYLPAGCTATKH
jgi:P4 family phage/plasmid primase-like protien